MKKSIALRPDRDRRRLARALHAALQPCDRHQFSAHARRLMTSLEADAEHNS